MRFLFVCALLVAAISPAGGQSASIDPPATSGSTFPALASESVTTLRREPDLLMTWLEPGGRLRFSRLVGDTWGLPITIATNVVAEHRMDRPSLTVLDTQAVRRTLIARTGDTIARSGDAGRTWTRLPAPALPFASFAGGEEGGYAFWLGAADGDSAELLGTRILAGEALLDPSVASAVGTSAAMTWDGPVVVYRDRGAEGALDVTVIRRHDARWTRPRPVHHVAGWRPSLEPKSGPEIAARERFVAVAWYTDAPHRARILVVFSHDAGRTFEAPVEVDVKQGNRVPQPQVDVAVVDDDHALLLWLARDGSAPADLLLARVDAGGRSGEHVVVAKDLLVESVGLPQIVRLGDQVAVTWTDGLAGRVRAVRGPLADVPAWGPRRSHPAELATQQAATVKRVPDVELASLDGDRVSLAALQGRVVLLNLWATWCMPCIAEMPELAALYRRYRAQGLEVVGLSIDDADAIDRVRTFVGEREIPFQIWLDPESRVYDALRVKALPATFVVNREGQILLRRDGIIKADDSEILRTLEEALGQ